MARFNPDLMQLDDGATGAPRVAGPRTDTTQITFAEVQKALDAAAEELGLQKDIPFQAEAELFAPIGGKTPAGNPSVADQDYFISNGFTVGNLPEKYQGLFGSDPSVIGWKETTDAKGVKQIVVARPQGDADGGYQFQTYGATFKNDPTGKPVPYSEPTGNALTSGLEDGLDSGAGKGGPTLAFNTFKNTLGLFFGQDEVNKAWVNELYKLASPYYKTGSTVDEALNLALQEGRKNPNLKEFTARFDGIFKLQDKLVSGMAVTVPTIAEFVASEAKMGEVLNAAGLGSLNTQKFLGERIGDGLNVAEFTKRINDVYLRIDSLPQQAKQTINRYLPTVDKPQLAKALLMGSKGAAELAKEVSSYEVLSAAEQQGLGTLTTAGQIGLVGGVDLAQAADFAAMGYDFNTANQALGQVAYNAPTYEKILEINTGKDVTAGAAAQGLIQSDIKKLASAERAKAQAIATEAARFAGGSGNLGSRSFKTQTSI